MLLSVMNVGGKRVFYLFIGEDLFLSLIGGG
ncbi:MAG: hypothetical protein BTN85_2150 [Candidatus Methanohalarchaeum thermophilum]|uniref:Uncharacterized protein n=1 Tax=Methanohalarchaeum thermophilum TaxID=1903181 RepID=A0A1Q6DT09_METT1|nr:MAG: hypothetical protein BTN85_2150 [Candidatus Methanohalarchaeum thermophilum]